MSYIRKKMRNSSGLTLVELLVAVAIGLILMGGIYQVFVSSTTAYSRNENMSRIQENGRFAAQILQDTIYGAGFLGCSQDPGNFESLIRDSAVPTDPLIYNYLQPVYGLEWTGGAWADDLGAVDPVTASPQGMGLSALVDDSDILVVRHIAHNLAFDLHASMASASSVINVGAGIQMFTDAIATATRAPKPLLIADCESSSMFIPSAYDNATGDISFDGMIPGALPAELNYLTAGQSWNDPSSFSQTYLLDSQVYFPQTTIFYVRSNPSGQPALYRKVGFFPDEELVEGVEMMQLRYGVDNIGDDRIADDYVTANLIGDWDDVVSVRIGLLLRTLNENLRGGMNNRSYDVNEFIFNSANADLDRRSRTVVNMTIGLRNRLR